MVASEGANGAFISLKKNLPSPPFTPNMSATKKRGWLCMLYKMVKTDASVQIFQIGNMYYCAPL